MIYHSTRNQYSEQRTCLEAVLRGTADDGGLYVPNFIPQLPWERVLGLDFRTIAAKVLSLYFEALNEDECAGIIANAYSSGWRDENVVSLREVGDIHLLELFHGPTCAFKDVALGVLPWLVKAACSRLGISEKMVVLTATSGDTGKAALEGFSNVPGTMAAAFYPKGGVSPVQELQMTTQRGLNARAIGVSGDFDAIQSAVKSVFGDAAFADKLKGMGAALTSANSINVGRLIPQISYYYYAYAELIREGSIAHGDEVIFAVPTGNFGNILAAWYARCMGLPVARLICASNMNDVLTRFFKTGKYNRNRKLHLTESPSMDILVSSNLERFLYHTQHNNPALIDELMKRLSTTGSFELSSERMDAYSNLTALSAGDGTARREIKRRYDESGYVLDPHTAVGAACVRKYRRNTGDDTPVILAATASPFKFAGTVLEALGANVPENPFDQLDTLAQFSGSGIPSPLSELRNLPVLHDYLYKPADIRQAVLDFVGGADQ